MKIHLKMLCVDDNRDLRETLAAQFRAEDFDVETAVDGLDAVEKLRHGHFDIVLLDLKMPGMDGLGVMKEMKKLTKFPHVVVLSAIDDVAMAQECVKMGARDYISKPYDPEDLLHVVIKVLGS